MTGNDVLPPEPPEGSKGKFFRGALNAIGGAIPFVGGLFSAAAGAWSEADQERLNRFFRHWIKMMDAEMAEKERTIIEIMQRLDMHDEDIADRVSSDEYQSLLRKGFRDWGGAESEEKRVLIRNVLANAGATKIASDDLVRLFLEWIKKYSELHFAIVGKIYNNSGITRSEVWESLGRGPVREDSADADLFKLLFRELSTGSIIRQHRETDHDGNFIRKAPQRRQPSSNFNRTMKSAFDDQESYELTKMGEQFVHYAMTDLPLKLDFKTTEPAQRADAPDTSNPASQETVTTEEAA